MHKSQNDADYNVSFEETKTPCAVVEDEGDLKPAIPLSADGNGYFHFNNN